MNFLGFIHCKADPELWMRRYSVNKGYWEYVLFDGDDYLCVSNRTELMLRNEIVEYFYLKDELI